MPDLRRTTYDVELILAVDETSDPHLQTPEGIREDLIAHYDYLRAVVQMVSVRAAEADDRREP